MKNCKRYQNKMEKERIKNGKIYCSKCLFLIEALKKNKAKEEHSKIFDMSFGYFIGNENYDLKKSKKIPDNIWKQIIIKNKIVI